MPVQYTSTGGTTTLTPAPLVGVSKEYDRLGDGTIIGVRYQITLTGKILAFKGAPGSKATAGDTDAYQGAIQSSQKAIRDLFADEGGLLEITPWDGTSNQLTCYPRLTSIDFSNRDPLSWFNVCDYTIALEADYVDGAWSTNEDKFDFAVSSASETFDFGETDGSYQYHWNSNRTDLQSVGKVFTFSRTISAVGKKRYDDSTAGPDSPSPLLDGGGSAGGGEAWQQASGYVLTKYGLGYSRTNLADGSDPKNYPTDDLPIPTSFLGLPDYYKVYNHKRNVQVDRAAGSFSVTEEWVFASGTDTNGVTEDTNISVNTSNSTGLTSVSINGTLQAYNGDKYSAPFVLDDHTVNNWSVVKDSWENNVEPNIYSMALALAKNSSNKGFYGNLHPLPLSTSVARNPGQGSISFDYQFDTRPENCVPGTLNEIITVNDQSPGQTVVQSPVIGRILGPVMQNVGTQGPSWSRSLTIDLTVSGIAPAGCDAASIGVWLTDMKPSNRTTPYNQKSAIEAIARGAAPHGKPGVTKAFTTPTPSESWDPKTGKYTYNITWNYEINQSKYY